jgi:hypothetical protein
LCQQDFLFHMLFSLALGDKQFLKYADDSDFELHCLAGKRVVEIE